MRRAHRTLHPLIWILVAAFAAAAIWLGWNAKSASPTATLPEPIAQSVEEQD